MKFELAFLALWLTIVLAQQATVCTNELATSDDCADVLNPIACYNQYRFNGARTLTCIEGKDDADRKRKARQPLLSMQSSPDQKITNIVPDRHANAAAV